MAATYRYDQILHAGPERLVGPAQRHVAILFGKIRADVGVRMDDGMEPAALPLALLQRRHELLRVHHLSVALRPRADLVPAGAVADGKEANAPRPAVERQCATL